ncbi:MAG: RNA 2',3'-cyclic phosphodiesterase [archaeon]|nr:RNA 2',3'-cyclic phosphodiesterase [archaeon]
MRLFTAITIPEKQREKIYAELIQELPEQMKAVEKQNIHLTLVFIGEKNTAEAKNIQEKLSKIKHHSFQITLCGIGCFGSRVMWLGAKEGEKEITQLAEKIFAELKIPKEQVVAHATLARNKKASPKEFFGAKNNLSEKKFSTSFEATGFVLVKSSLTKDGPIYEEFPEITFSKRDSGS